MLSHPKARINLLCNGLLLGFFFVGCAGQSLDKPITVQNESCKLGSTLVCEERMGKVYQCSCESRKTLRDILEPKPH